MKKIFIVLLILAVLFSSASVWANDINETIITNTNQNEELIEIENQNIVNDTNVCETAGLTENQNHDSIIVENNRKNNVAEIENEKLSTAMGTLTDLANEIKNAGNELKLTKNYVYSSQDSDYKLGINITKKITIEGNGFTIDGNNMARIFKVYSDNVVLKNINFVNSYRDDDYYDGLYHGSGGAIYWVGQKGILFNCNFVNCHTTDRGGAICFDSKSNYINISHCSFKNCSVSGALFLFSDNVIISDCSFNDCSETAINGYGDNTKITNCNFVNCSISAIFIYWDVKNAFISHCNFNECNGLGGGIDISGEGIISNCTFMKCSSPNNGGAILVGGNPVSILDCNFIECSAKNGGAIYCGGNHFTVKNSNFTNNKASENGGALYGGTEYNCLFINNTATMKGVNAYMTDVSKSTLNISNFQPIYEYGSKLSFDFRTILGLQIKYATITIQVFKDGALVGTYKTLSGNDWVVNLGAGSYELILSVENQDYYVNSVNAILNVVKLTTKITSSPVTTTYNINKDIIITLKNKNNLPISNEIMFIDFDGLRILYTDFNGQIKLSTQNLIPKSYKVSIMFPGNDYYIESALNILVTVKKATPKLTANTKTFKKSVKIKKYAVTLKNNLNKAMKNTKVTLKINREIYTAKTNKNGVATFKINKLTKKGTFKSVVTYNGDKYYNKITKKVNIKVK